MPELAGGDGRVSKKRRRETKRKGTERDGGEGGLYEKDFKVRMS